MSNNGNNALLERMLARDPSLDAYIDIDLSPLGGIYTAMDKLQCRINVENFDKEISLRPEGMDADKWIVSECYGFDAETVERLEKENRLMLSALSNRALKEHYAYWDRLKKA